MKPLQEDPAPIGTAVKIEQHVERGVFRSGVEFEATLQLSDSRRGLRKKSADLIGQSRLRSQERRYRVADR
jgi:hypothetical protein